MTRETDYFRGVASDTRFAEWLELELAKSVKFLVRAGDTTAINRSQGRVQLIEEIQAQIKAAKELR